MKNPTLGYEDDQEITKSELGRIQLVEAINLFLNRNFICAITLAGASEAIFSGILSNLGIPTATEQTIEHVEKIREMTGLQVAEGLPKNKIFNVWNSARNDLKHHSKGEPDRITLNLFDEAYWMIRRALENSRAASIHIENSQEFENWVIENICM